MTFNIALARHLCFVLENVADNSHFVQEENSTTGVDLGGIPLS